MKAQIQDPQVLASFSPTEVVAYLRSTHWVWKGDYGDDATVWCRDDHTVVVPSSTSFADYARRLGEVVTTLEEVEKRSQLEIARDLFSATSDVFRVRLASPSVDDGIVGIEEGVALVTSAHEMVQAAARAAVTPKAYFRSRLPVEAEDYMEKVRLGQTEQGSYVITIVCPVTPELQRPVTDGEPMAEDGEPFDRRVTRTLAASLHEIALASKKAVLTGTLPPFEEAVCKGVSANLCNAVAQVGNFVREGMLHFSFSWARSRTAPAPGSTPSQIEIGHDLFPVLKEAARLLRETSWDDEFEIVGPVIRLESPHAPGGGYALVHAVVDERPRRVRLVLTPDWYQQATQAHANALDIRCVGKLQRDGRYLTLHSPKEFAVIQG